MGDIRIYRALFVPVLLAVTIAMFSLGSQPPAGSTPFAPDAFDAARTMRVVQRLAKGYPDRRPGGGDDGRLARLVSNRLRRLGYSTSSRSFSAPVNDKKVQMSNVVGVLSGGSDRRIVLVAHRDAIGPSTDPATVVPTATLLELASVIKRLSHRKTIVVVSTDGKTAGAAGARHLAGSLPRGSGVDAVLVLDGIFREDGRAPETIPWGAGPGVSPLGVVKTADRALRTEVGRETGIGRGVRQLFRLAFPVTLTEQGPLVAAGLPAVAMTMSGELPVAGSGSASPRVSTETVRSFGKAALATALAVDRDERTQESPSGYMKVMGKVVPEWVIRMLVLTLWAPVFVVGVDNFFRARRRRQTPGAWVLWVLAASLPFFVVLLYSYAFDWVGFLAEVPSYPFDPGSYHLDTQAALAIVALAFIFALSWYLVKRATARELTGTGDAGNLGAGSALVVVFSIEVLVIWIWNPFAALLLMPAAHLWMPAALPEPPLRRWQAGTLLVAGLVLPAMTLAYYASALDLGGGVFYYMALLVAGGYVSLWWALVLCILAGSFVRAVTIAWATSRHRGGEMEITLRGPASYAGPGSLGGTESARR